MQSKKKRQILFYTVHILIFLFLYKRQNNFYDFSFLHGKCTLKSASYHSDHELKKNFCKRNRNIFCLELSAQEYKIVEKASPALLLHNTLLVQLSWSDHLWSSTVGCKSLLRPVIYENADCEIFEQSLVWRCDLSHQDIHH